MAAEDIVYVDDQKSYAKVLGRSKGLKGRIHYVDPSDEISDNLAAAAAANLWVFDFFYGEGERNEPALKFGDPSGLTTLKSWEDFFFDARPVSVLVSGHLDAALGASIVPARRHVLALDRGVDWVAPKTSDTIDTGREIAMLADATRSAKEIVASCRDEDFVTLTLRLLDLSIDKPWFEAALLQLSASPMPRPAKGRPLPNGQPRDLVLATARSYLVWILHRMLPYAGPLVSDVQVAARLGISLKAFRQLADGKAKSGLARELARCRFTGVLAGFDGRRWWRAGIDLLVWQATRKERGLRNWIEKAAGVDDAFLGFDSAVVVSDDNLVPTDEIADADACIRIIDEHAPPNALPIWVERETVSSNKDLRSRVAFEDRDRVVPAHAS